jgi:Ion channel
VTPGPQGWRTSPHSTTRCVDWPTTVTTVGYGDHFPVTGQGRLIAVALMVIGIAAGAVTASVAAWLGCLAWTTPTSCSFVIPGSGLHGVASRAESEPKMPLCCYLDVASTASRIDSATGSGCDTDVAWEPPWTSRVPRAPARSAPKR